MWFGQAKHAATSQLPQSFPLLELQQELDAIRNHTAYICFSPTGEILDANELFLSVVGYSKSEVVGQHHRIFCPVEYTQSSQYREFWLSLSQGHGFRGTFLRQKKNREAIYLEASYFPVVDGHGRVTKVVKIASDVTESTKSLKAKNAILEALNRSLAVIEFTLDGTILTANDNFLDIMGYRLSDVQGQHHKMFCFPEFYHENPDFWTRLRHGEHFSGRFKRKNAHNQVIWVEATYNPILDEHGKVEKVVKFAADISERVNAAMQAVDMAATTSEETSQITTMAIQVLNDAVETSQKIAHQVQEASGLGNQLMDQSKNIDEIVTTIKGIADQTNLLALNAAIEAARAGDSGRGFAVVADEVRKLASRTSSATEEIAHVVSGNASMIKEIDHRLNAINGVALHGQDSINHVALGLADVGNGVNQFVLMVERLKP